MGVVFDDLIYAKNNNIVKGKIYLKSINYSFNCGTIYGFIGDASIIVGKLLVLDKRPSKGSININGITVSKTSKISNIDLVKSNLKFVDFNEKNIFVEKSFIAEIKYLLKDKTEEEIMSKALMALKMVGLSEDYLNYNLHELSNSVYRKILLAFTLCSNPKVLVLNDFDKGLSDKDKLFYKRLFVKLKTRYNKLIVIISSDVRFMNDLVDTYLVFNEGNVIFAEDKAILYNFDLYKYIDKINIVDFVKYVNDNDISINQSVDVKELLKDIYRNLENKK